MTVFQIRATDAVIASIAQQVPELHVVAHLSERSIAFDRRHTRSDLAVIAPPRYKGAPPSFARKRKGYAGIGAMRWRAPGKNSRTTRSLLFAPLRAAISIATCSASIYNRPDSPELRYLHARSRAHGYLPLVSTARPSARSGARYFARSWKDRIAGIDDESRSHALALLKARVGASSDRGRRSAHVRMRRSQQSRSTLVASSTSPRTGRLLTQGSEDGRFQEGSEAAPCLLVAGQLVQRARHRCLPFYIFYSMVGFSAWRFLGRR